MATMLSFTCTPPPTHLTICFFLDGDEYKSTSVLFVDFSMLTTDEPIPTLLGPVIPALLSSAPALPPEEVPRVTTSEVPSSPIPPDLPVLRPYVALPDDTWASPHREYVAFPQAIQHPSSPPAPMAPIIPVSASECAVSHLLPPACHQSSFSMYHISEPPLSEE